jgi:hypothetical protein
MTEREDRRLRTRLYRMTDQATLTRLQGEMEAELKRLFGVARAALAAP